MKSCFIIHYVTMHDNCIKSNCIKSFMKYCTILIVGGFFVERNSTVKSCFCTVHTCRWPHRYIITKYFQWETIFLMFSPQKKCTISDDRWLGWLWNDCSVAASASDLGLSQILSFGGFSWKGFYLKVKIKINKQLRECNVQYTLNHHLVTDGSVANILTKCTHPWH